MCKATRLMKIKDFNLFSDDVTGINGDGIPVGKLPFLLAAYPTMFAIAPDTDGQPTLFAEVPVGEGLTLNTTSMDRVATEVHSVEFNGDNVPLLIRLFGAWTKPKPKVS